MAEIVKLEEPFAILREVERRRRRPRPEAWRQLRGVRSAWRHRSDPAIADYMDSLTTYGAGFYRNP